MIFVVALGGLLLAVIALHVALAVSGFRRSVVEGLVSLFVPLSSLGYAFACWRTRGTRWLAASLVVAALTFGVVFWMANTAASEAAAAAGESVGNALFHSGGWGPH